MLIPRNAVQWIFGLAWTLVAIKLIATLYQAIVLRHDYKNRPNTTLFRVMYVAGKATLALAAAAVAIAYALQGNRTTAWEFGVLAVAVATLAIVVVRLRQQGKFYGAGYLISNGISNASLS